MKKKWDCSSESKSTEKKLIQQEVNKRNKMLMHKDMSYDLFCYDYVTPIHVSYLIWICFKIVFLLDKVMTNASWNQSGEL